MSQNSKHRTKAIINCLWKKAPSTEDTKKKKPHKYDPVKQNKKHKVKIIMKNSQQKEKGMRPTDLYLVV